MRHFLIALTAAFILHTAGAAAQTAKPELPKIPGMEEVERGQALEQEGKAEEAMKLYRQAYEAYGTDNSFWHLLIVLDRLKQYEELGKLIQTRLDKTPGDFTMIRYLARSYFGRGDTKKGLALIDDIIANDWRNIGRIHTAANELLRWNELDRAMDVYLKSRKAIGNEQVFINEIARIHTMRLEYPEALEEYLKILETVAATPARIENLISAARQMGVNEDDLIRPLKDYLADRPQSVKCAKLLSDFYWKKNAFQEAVDVYLPALLKTKDQNELKAFAVRLKQFYPAGALKVYEAYAALFPDDPLRKAILFEAAALHLELGDSNAAMRIYERLSKDYPGTKEGETAELRILAISGDTGSPEKFIERIAAFAGTAQHRENAREAWFIGGRLHLAEGHPDSALDYFGQSVIKSRTNEERYPVSVFMAYAKFFTGDFKGMSEAIIPVLSSDPAGKDTNDLLNLKTLVLQAGTSGEQSVKSYAGAKYALFRNSRDEARALFSEAYSDTSSSVSPHAALELAVMSADDGDIALSLDWFMKASAATEDPTLKAGSLLMAGDFLLEKTGDKSNAAELYREALLMYPDSVHHEELRRKLISLAEDS